MSRETFKVYGVLTVIGIFQISMVWMLMNFNTGPGESRRAQLTRVRDSVIHQDETGDISPVRCSICRLCRSTDGSCRDGIAH